MDLKEKRVIVSGGVRGLGRCLVDMLIAKGALVTVFDIDQPGMEALSQQYKTVSCMNCDVSDPDKVATALDTYHGSNGAAHVLVNNAGILFSQPLVRIGSGGLERHTVEAWNRVLSANLSSVFYMTSQVVERMVATRTKGVIVNISSVAAAGNAGQSVYSAAKAGVNALTATWAKELGVMGIRVVAVAPGFSETESTKEAVSEAVLQETIKRVPLRRLGKPEEIADGVIAVIENDFFNGKVFELDGGLII